MNNASHAQPEASAIVDFWRHAGAQSWFRKDADFDREFSNLFFAAHLRAAARQLDHWNEDAIGALALQILLDQLPRNAFRGNAHAYATDSLAQHFALAAIDHGLSAQIETQLRPFSYMALMHAEDLALQQRCVTLFEALGGPSLEFAHEHHDIIKRFGRFPHRNTALGRSSTREELDFLAAGGFAG
jgi:uncharacterized protein (DUF924 family)